MITRWARRVVDDPSLASAHRLGWPALVGEVPAVVDLILDALAASSAALDPDGAVRSFAECCRRAERHACGRFVEGHTIAGAMRELAHLRAALIEACFDEGDAIDVRDAQSLHAVIDAIMWTSAVEIEKATRAALEDNEARLRLATEAGGVGVWDYNPVTGEMRWDARSKAISGLPPDATLDYETFTSVVHPDDRARTEEAVRRSLDPATGGEYRVEYRVVGVRDGVERWVDVHGRAWFDAAGVGVRMIGTVIDISERKRAEQARLEELAFRDRFMTALGHYLRTPLTSIALATSVLIYHGELSPRQAKAANRIATSARRMGRAIDDLLDLTRCRLGGEIPIAPEDGDLHAICRGVIDELGRAHPATPIQLELAGDGAGSWDAARIAQMVQNLVCNALDYSAAGRPVDVSVVQQANELLIRVHNDGPSIAPEIMATLFDPFRRRSGAGRLSSGRGLGLGLFIASQIAKAHGGSIDAASAPEQGTTFTVRLPRGPRGP